MKTGLILDEDSNGYFALEFENGRGATTTMRLEANSYEQAVREAKTFLGIKQNNHDEDGTLWDIR